MKKFLLFITISLLAFSLTGCGASAGSEKEYNDMIENMKNADNFTATVVVVDPEYGEFTQIVKVDGDKGVVNLFDINFFYTTENDSPQIITAIDLGIATTNYYGEEVVMSEIDNLLSEVTIFNEFSYDDFTYEDGRYVADVIKHNIQEVSFNVKDGYMDIINYKLALDGVELEISTRFFNFDETEVNLPEYITDQDFIDKKAEVETLFPTYGLVIDITEFRLTTYDTTYVYVVGGNSIIFNQLDGTFYPDTFEVEAGENTYTVAEYVLLDDAMGDEDLFNLLLELYRLYVGE